MLTISTNYNDGLDRVTYPNTARPGRYRGELSVLSCGVVGVIKTQEDGQVVLADDSAKDPQFLLVCSLAEVEIENFKHWFAAFDGDNVLCWVDDREANKLSKTTTKFSLTDGDCDFLRDTVHSWLNGELETDDFAYVLDRLRNSS